MKTFKRLREEAMISQTNLAIRMGISRQTLSDWERAKARPGPDNLRKLVEILGKPASEILDALDATARERKEKEKEKENERPAA